VKKFFDGIKHYILLLVAFVFLGTFLGTKVVRPKEAFIEATSSNKNVNNLIAQNDKFNFEFLPDGTIKNIKTNYKGLYEYPDTFMNIGFKINGYIVPISNLNFVKEGNNLVADVVNAVRESTGFVTKKYKIVLNCDVLSHETKFNYKCFEILPNGERKSVDLVATLLLQFSSNASDLKINEANVITFDGERYKHSYPSNAVIETNPKNGFGFGFGQNKHFLYLKFHSGWSNISNVKIGNSVQLYCEEIKNFSGFSLYGGPLDLKFLQQYNLKGILDTGFLGFISINFVKFLEYLNNKTGNAFIASALLVFLIYLLQLLISIGFIRNIIKRYRIEKEIDNLGPDMKKEKKEITKIHMLQQNNINYFTSSSQLIIMYQLLFSAFIKKVLDLSYLFYGTSFLWIKNIALPEPYSIFNLYGYFNFNLLPSIGIFCIIFNLITQIVLSSIYKEEVNAYSTFFILLIGAWWLSNYNVVVYMFLILYYVLLFITNRLIFIYYS
jgi:hypothetical protein